MSTSKIFLIVFFLFCLSLSTSFACDPNHYSKWQNDFAWCDLDTKQQEDEQEDRSLAWYVAPTHYWDGILYSKPTFSAPTHKTIFPPPEDMDLYQSSYLAKKIVNGQPWFYVELSDGAKGWIPGYDRKKHPLVTTRFGMGC